MEKSFREVEHATWTERASDYDGLFAPVTRQAIASILDSLGSLRDKRHLDVACGTGHLVAAAARRGARSEGIDFAEAMVAAARANYPGQRYQVGDGTRLPYGEGTFDAVSCAFGLSHMERPDTAVGEAFRVLKPGGRFAFTLWFGPAEGNESMALFQEAVAACIPEPPTLPEGWTRLRNADETACRALTDRAGFRYPSFQRLPILWKGQTAGDVDTLFERMSIRNKWIISQQPPEVKQRIMDTIRQKANHFRKNGGIALAWPALLTVAQKPG